MTAIGLQQDVFLNPQINLPQVYSNQADNNSQNSIFDSGNTSAPSVDFDYSLDDGKISFKDKASSFFTGAFDKVKDQATSLFKSAKENPIMAAGCVALGVATCLACAAFPIVGGIVGTIGAGYGAYKMVQTGKEMHETAQELKNSTSDEQTRAILEEMGGEATEFAQATLTTAASTIGAVGSIKTAIHTANATNIGNNAWNALETASDVQDFGVPNSLQASWDKMRLDQQTELLKAAGWSELSEKAIIAEEISMVPWLVED